jgi:hypothetical protein
LIRRPFSTETRSRTNARRSLALVQLRRHQAAQEQPAVDEALLRAPATGG